MQTITKYLVGAALVAFAHPTSAADWIYFNSGASNSGNGLNFSDGNVNVRASGWSVDYASIVHDATLGYYSEGLGVSYGKDNSHTIDNVGSYDFVLLQFDRAVTLDSASFRTGWHSMNDTDAQIAYGNLAMPYTFQAGFNNKLAMSALSDFSVYQSGSNGKSGNSTRNINPGAYSGNSWIVAAGQKYAPDHYADGFKLKGVSYTVTPSAVPEPATWAMLLFGFGAIGSARRRRPARTRVSFA